MKKPKLPEMLIASAIIVLITIIAVRSFSNNRFRNNAEKWIQKSVDKSNLITPSELANLKSELLIVDMSGNKEIPVKNATFFQVDAGRIIDKENLKRLRNHDGDIILFSGDLAISARIWMIMSQMGIKNLYILDSTAVNAYK